MLQGAKGARYGLVTTLDGTFQVLVDRRNQQQDANLEIEVFYFNTMGQATRFIDDDFKRKRTPDTPIPIQ